MMLTAVLLTDINLDFALNNMLIFIFMNLEILHLKKLFRKYCNFTFCNSLQLSFAPPPGAPRGRRAKFEL